MSDCYIIIVLLFYALSYFDIENLYNFALYVRFFLSHFSDRRMPKNT